MSRGRGLITWWNDPGIGYLPITDPAPYDDAYFSRYAEQAETPIGRELNRIRVEQVNRVTRGEVVDVGIGSGAFIDARLKSGALATFGYDVNPAGLRWLNCYGRFFDVYEHAPEAITLWDVLEHIPDFTPLLRQVRRYVFLSIPICRNVDHAHAFKHFRPREHCWYFTHRGLIAVMEMHGFRLVDNHHEEVRAGRQDVGSYTFMRR